MDPHTSSFRASLQHTKILCTLGPATASKEKISEIIHAGADAIRLNFSHSDHSVHEELFRMTREAAADLGRHVPIIQDLQGPKIRVGALPDGPVLLQPGTAVVLTTDAVESGDARIPVGYKGLPGDVRPGNSILLDDGLIALNVDKANGADVHCTVVNGGLLNEKKGINLPGVNVSEPSLTTKDREDLAFGLALGVDYVALSFVRSAREVVELKELIASLGYATPVIAKIEKLEAIHELEQIIDVADALMVARGDLGVEMPAYDVPLLQKRIIACCNSLGKPVITATQMLESMIQNPRPTRAESSDVANAVFDGSDVVMLSAETSVGAWPVEAVATMNDILRASEAAEQYSRRQSPAYAPIGAAREGVAAEVAVAGNACLIARQVRASAILCLTYTGATARVMSRSNPDCPVIAMVSGPDELCRQLGIYRSVYSVSIRQPADTEDAVAVMKQAALSAGILRQDELVVITTGYPLDEKASTNMIVVEKV